MSARPRNGLGRRLLRRFRRREDGSASFEFALFVSITVTVFMASAEASLFMIKHVMLERGLDLVMRDFRLGRLATLTHDQIRDKICDATPVLTNCNSELKVWIEPIDTTSFATPNLPAYCGDRNGTLESQPTGSVNHGSPDQIMFVRVCALQKPIFPSTGIGLHLRADSLGHGYQIAATTIAVNEPR